MSEPQKPNYFLTSDGDTINLDQLVQIQLDSTKIYFIVGSQLGTATSGSNATYTKTYGSTGAAQVEYNKIQALLRALGKVTDIAIPSQTIVSITPNNGTNAGGTACDIAGTGFNAGSKITIGGNVVPWSAFISPTLYKVITPAHANGAVDVVITDRDPTLTALTLVAGYTYV